jgi:hypothetical protein
MSRDLGMFRLLVQSDPIISKGIIIICPVMSAFTAGKLKMNFQMQYCRLATIFDPVLNPSYWINNQIS